MLEPNGVRLIVNYLAGRIALITGASSGIGRAVAKAFASAGVKVVLAARRADRLEALRDEIEAAGGSGLAFECDVTDERAVERLYAAIAARFGTLDILVNSAGIVDHTPTDELSLARWRHVIDTNLTGAFLCSREALRVMKPRGRGRLIHIGSLSAKVPRAHTIAYSATKFALDGLSHSLAIDGRAHGVASSIFHPGIIVTELVPTAPDRDPATFIHVDDAARAIVAMADVPDHVNFVEATMLPIGMDFLGRG